MVNAAGGILRQEPGDRGILAQRVDQLDAGVLDIDKHHRDPVGRLRQRCRHGGAELVAISAGRRRKVGHGDRHVVQPAKHGRSPRLFSGRHSGEAATSI